MHSENGVDPKLVEQAVLHHGVTAAFFVSGFLCRLEDEVNGAIEIAMFGEVARRAEQHRGMPVMPAGVHLPIDLRAIFKGVLFLDEQRVHISAQTDGGLTRAPLERADDAGPAESAMDLEPKVLEL